MQEKNNRAICNNILRVMYTVYNVNDKKTVMAATSVARDLCRLSRFVAACGAALSDVTGDATHINHGTFGDVIERLDLLHLWGLLSLNIHWLDGLFEWV